MKQYKQLTTEQRYQIYGLKQSGLNQTQIAHNVGVDKSTISREFRRNRGKRGWRPNQAQSFRDERKKACNNGKQFTLSEWAEVERLIRKDLSPEQTANRLKLEGGCRSAMKQSISMYMLTSVTVATFAVTCVVRNNAVSAMPVGINDVV